MRRSSNAFLARHEQGAGRQLNGELVAAKALAKAQKEGVREHAANVNALKKRIDELQVSGSSWLC